ncbi:YibE/F family protein [Conexibacter sp. W3-3-2]|uniref:YibE/F family protein n=1 Tax=Conexibacter sp. W3-3-2 TaxID=2675227 RepID=UPI002815C562|nr:YibE/F family protein [Conexibacter sp. W3-3-2]
MGQSSANVSSPPTLLILSASVGRFGDSVNSEPVAQEVVAMLAGSVGLMIAVPLTTALAATLTVRLRPETLAGVHAHTH